MTLAEFDLFLKRVTFGPPFDVLGVRAKVNEAASGDERWAEFRLNYETRDRDTGRALRLNFSMLIPIFELADDRAAMQMVRRALVGCLEHEADESLKLDGVRWFEPHPERTDHARPQRG